MELNFLTNPDSNRQEKMRFFADYFLFTNEYIGRVPDIPLDNPYSLLDKIIYQIAHNPKYFHIYIGNYLEQFFSFYKTGCMDEILVIKSLYKEYNLQDKKIRNDWIKSNPSFIAEIKRLHFEFKTKLFEENFSVLFSFMNCSHNLQEHKDHIRYSVQILVSQFRLNGYSKKHVDSVIQRILSKTDGFPFPPEITSIEDKLERQEAQDNYLAKRDFKEQFYGLQYLLTRANVQQGIFIYLIRNCLLENGIKDSFKIMFDDVTFISPTHSLLAKLKKSVFENTNSMNHKIKNLFFDDNVILALVTLNYENLNFSKTIGLNKVKDELQQLNNYINGDLRVDANHFIFTKNLDEIENVSVSLLGDRVAIRKSHLTVLEVNPYEFLRDISSESKNQILYNERIFFRSIDTNDVTYYWHYIESLFSSVRDNAELIQKEFSELLFQQIPKLKNEFLSSINFLVCDFYFDYKQVGLEEDDIFIPAGGAMKKWNPELNITLLESKIKSPFLKFVIDYYKKYDSKEQLEKWRQYFQSLMLELYEYRNLVLHTGKINEYAKLKLEVALPELINKARWELINACRKNPTLNFKELIELVSCN